MNNTQKFCFERTRELTASQLKMKHIEDPLGDAMLIMKAEMEMRPGSKESEYNKTSQLGMIK